LKDVIDEIKSDDPKTIQPNGNIHPITIEVNLPNWKFLSRIFYLNILNSYITKTITFIENLLPFDVIAGVMANVVGIYFFLYSSL
jgi:hypothetical protein